mgnify:CR=1 FL=1
MRAWASLFFLCLQLAVAANDACPGNGKKPKREDRLTRLAQQYNSERCKAAIERGRCGEAVQLAHDAACLARDSMLVWYNVQVTRKLFETPLSLAYRRHLCH